MALRFTEQTITCIIQKDSEYLNVDSKLTVQKKTVDICRYNLLPSIGKKTHISRKMYTAFPYTGRNDTKTLLGRRNSLYTTCFGPFHLPILHQKKKLSDLLYIGNLISVFCSTVLIYSLFVHHFFIPSNLTSISLLFSNQADYCILYFTASEIKTVHLLCGQSTTPENQEANY